MTDTAARADVLRDAMLAAVTGDQATIERAYTEDVTGWSPVLEIGSRDDLAADLAGRSDAFSDVDLVLDPVDAVGDKVIAEWRLAATHSGLLTLDEELALEPTGRRVELRGVVVAEFEGDRIRRFRQYWNEVELLDGLGLLPEA
jgi:ketosteroid isomerase-like protein